MTKHNNNSLIEHTKTYAEFSIKLKLLAIALLFCVGSYIDTRKNKFSKNDSVNAYSRKLGKKAHRKHHSKRKNGKLDDLQFRWVVGFCIRGQGVPLGL